MTTREQIIAAAKECFDWYEYGRGRVEYSTDEYGLERFYAIAIEAGRVAEREECLTALGKVMVTDHSLRTYNRCLDAIRARGESK